MGVRISKRLAVTGDLSLALPTFSSITVRVQRFGIDRSKEKCEESTMLLRGAYALRMTK